MKPGANSGEKVYGWAEYSQVTFTPSGDNSPASRVVGILVVLMALLIVPIIFIAAGHAAEGPNRVVDIILMGLTGTGIIGFAAILLMFFAATVRMIAEILADRRERGQKTLNRPRDEGANRVRLFPMKNTPFPPEAPKHCALCPRLVEYRQTVAVKEPDWFNGAVPSFGDEAAELLVIGLAPGVTGANRTGRPFTGDWAGDLLYATLDKFGFSEGTYAADPGDGLALTGAMITNAVRCVPPENKPVGAEINACRPFLVSRISALPKLKVMLCLGKISHDSTVRALGLKLKDHPFGHGTRYEVNVDGRDYLLVSSYHCSRYNTNTGRLTAEMFEDVFAMTRKAIG